LNRLKNKRLVIVEEAWPLASISSEITFNVQKNVSIILDAPIRRVTCADVHCRMHPTLIEASLPIVKKGMQAVKDVMYRS